jgi:hypothetical protein
MSIESTFTVKRSNAIKMLLEKIGGDRVTNENLAELLYEYRDSVFENYIVVDDDFKEDEYDHMKSSW